MERWTKEAMEGVLQRTLKGKIPTDVGKRLGVAAGQRQHTLLNGLVRRIGRQSVERITVSGVESAYWTGGEGEAVVLIHGFGDQKETWSFLVPWLARRACVYAPDLPGFGESGPIEAERASLKSQAQWVLDFMDSLGVERAHIVGNSMGGGVALCLASQAPERVSSLFLLSSQGPEVVRSEMAKLFDETDANILLPRSVEEWEAMLDAIFVRRPPLPRLLRTYLAERHIQNRDTLEQLFDVLMHPPEGEGLPEDYGSIQTPTLIMHGREDRVIHYTTSQALCDAISDARLVVLPGVGHGPQWEVPRRVAEEYIDFLDRVAHPSS